LLLARIGHTLDSPDAAHELTRFAGQTNSRRGDGGVV
jgi:hypothetical protein